MPQRKWFQNHERSWQTLGAQLSSLMVANIKTHGTCEIGDASSAAQQAAAPDRGPFVWPGAGRASRAADFVRCALGMRGLADR